MTSFFFRVGLKPLDLSHSAIKRSAQSACMSTPSSVSALLATVPFGARGRSRRPPSVAGVGVVVVGVGVGEDVGTGVVVPPDDGNAVGPGASTGRRGPIRYCEAGHTLSCCSLQSSDRARTAASDAQKSHQRAISVTA